MPETETAEPVGEITARLTSLIDVISSPDSFERPDIAADRDAAIADMRERFPGVSDETLVRVAAYITDVTGGIYQDTRDLEQIPTMWVFAGIALKLAESL